MTTPTMATLICCAWILLGTMMTDWCAGQTGDTAVHRRYGAWHSGIIGGGGYLQQVHFCPSDAKRLYLTSDVGGFYRSDDLGQTWRMLHGELTDGAGGDFCRGLWVDPDDADRLLVAVDTGIYVSTDGGGSFRQTLKANFHGNNHSRNHGLILVSSPRDKNVLLAAADRQGVFRSADGGMTWKHHGPTNLWSPSALVFDEHNPQRVWLCVSGWKDHQKLELGLWRSDDEGQTWRKIAEQSPSEFLQDPQTPGRFYGLIDQRPVLSTDAGNTWVRFDDGLPAKTNDARTDGQYAAITAQGSIIALGGHGGHFYTLNRATNRWMKLPRGTIDEGDWWGRLGTGGVNHFGSALGYLTINPRNPQHWFFTDWYACYQSKDGGKSWKLSIDGIEMTVLHGVTQEPTQAGVVHGAMADLGYFRSTDRGRTYAWTPTGISNNIRPISVTLAQPGRAYAVGPMEWQWQANQVFVSDDAGKQWRRSAMRGLPDMKERRCNTIVADGRQRDRVYITVSGKVAAGEGGVYRSDDGGQNWTWMGAGLPTIDHLFRNNIWVHGPELASSSDGTLLAISVDRNRMMRYDNRAQRWAELQLPSGGSAFALFTDPHQAKRFYLCLQAGGLWRSDDGGDTWKQVLDRPAFWWTVDYEQPDHQAVVSAHEVLLSVDGGKNWAVLDKALPYRHMRNQVCFAGDRIIVGTGGNGAFWMNKTDAPVVTISAATLQLHQANGQNATGSSASQNGGTSHLRNGNMESGDATPLHWGLSDYRQGRLSVRRDTDVFNQGVGSLVLATDGRASGFVHQPLQPKPAGAFTVSGAVRVQGRFDQVLIAVQCFDADWKQVDWKTVFTAGKTSGEWQSFSSSITLTPNTVHAMLGVSVTGDGTVWLDDVNAITGSPSGLARVAATATAATAGAGASSADSTEPKVAVSALPVSVPAGDQRLRYVGRFQRLDNGAMRCAWPHSSLVMNVRASAVNVQVGDGGQNRLQVFIDHQPGKIIQLKEGTHWYALAENLPADRTHRIEVVRITEALFGELTFGGLQLAEGGLLEPMQPLTRRIEVIGDSISAGYGNEAPNQQAKFSPQTQNAALSYGALAARALGAEYHCIAWSGKLLWPHNTLTEVYDRVLPNQRDTIWNPAQTGWSPEVILINLGTNDFAGKNPEEEGWVNAYIDFVTKLRTQHPQAMIYAAVGPMLSDPHSPSKNALSTIRRYLQRIAAHFQKQGDSRVQLIEFATQRGDDGFGADWHPSLKTHRIMADKLIQTLKNDLQWSDSPMTTASASFQISTQFAGGNAIVESIEGDTIRLRPDLRDTEGNWFYWSVRVQGAAGRTLSFIFTAQNPLADRGPAMSLDQGRTWRWLGRQNGQRDQFTVRLPADGDDVILSFGMNYTLPTWHRFLDTLPGKPSVQMSTLTQTRQGRDVPMLRTGRLDGQAKYRWLLTARTHACEMMANYVMEGMIQSMLAEDDLGRWLRENVELVAVPFMDMDGVENGDQGKNRKPRDHNRDYAPPHVHVETGALVKWAAAYFDGRPAMMIDLHCPWIQGGFNEQVYQPGREDPVLWKRQQHLATLIQQHQQGPIPYGPGNDLPFGADWNTNANTVKGLSGSRWGGEQPGVHLGTTFEIPYATASGVEVNPETAKALGRDLARGVKAYLLEIK